MPIAPKVDTVSLNECYDYVNHCDETCSHVIIPYMNRIQRTLSAKHGADTYYQIPVVIQSICSAYYCHHIQYRLGFKSLFASFPTYEHFLSEQHNNECCYNWKRCFSIQRISHILKNYQQYLSQQTEGETDVVSPFITYKYYGIKQILYDIDHIHKMHPQNTVKFHIMHNVIGNEYKAPECDDQCMHHYNDDANSELCIHNNEEWIQYTISRAHNEYIHHSLSTKQFEDALTHIIIYNENVFGLLAVLRNISKKLAKYEDKYRTLDTTNPLVQERLLGFEGVLQFLSLLGFESNVMGTKLSCPYPPPLLVIHNAITSVDAYNPEIRPSVDDINQIPPINPISSAGDDDDDDAGGDRKESKKSTQWMKGFKHIRIRSMSKEKILNSVKRKLSAVKVKHNEEKSVNMNMNTMDVLNGYKAKKVMHWIGHKFKKKKYA